MKKRLLMCVLWVSFFACRDEQAGPKNRVTQQALSTLRSLPKDLTFVSGATFSGGAVEYLGSRTTPVTPQFGEMVTVSHFFRANRSPPAGYQFFVHLVDESNGQQVLNLDHEPQQGLAPLDAWPVGAIIEDSHVFTMPSGGGPHRLLLGFWQESTRLPVDLRDAHDGQNRMKGPGFGSLPEYRVARATVPPKIDGVLDDAVWQTASKVFLVGSFDGQKPLSATAAQLAYDDEHLYVAFDVEDSDIWGTLKNQDDAIYNEEVVEVFIDANGDGRTYNELQVSPHNVQFDAAFEERRKDLERAKTWKSGMRSAVKFVGTIDNPDDTDERWRVEMAIPHRSLNEVPSLPPGPNDVWRFNLYRLDHPSRKNVEGQALSPLFVGDFHHLPRFARLVFQ